MSGQPPCDVVDEAKALYKICCVFGNGKSPSAMQEFNMPCSSSRHVPLIVFNFSTILHVQLFPPSGPSGWVLLVHMPPYQTRRKKQKQKKGQPSPLFCLYKTSTQSAPLFDCHTHLGKRVPRSHVGVVSTLSTF